MICGRDIIGAIAHRVSQVNQDFVERIGGLMPLQLLDAVGSGGFAGPQFLQRRNLRFQLLQRGVEPRRSGVDFLADRTLDLVEVV